MAHLDRRYSDIADYTDTDYPYKELTFKIIGAVYKVHNTLGYGYQEKAYQKAIALELDKMNIAYKKELYSQLKYEGERITKYFLDFLIEDRIVLEIKVANEIYRKHFQQVLQYLKNMNLELGIISAINPDRVIIKRVINQKGRRNTVSSAKSA